MQNMEALTRAAAGDFAPEVLAALQTFARRIATAPTDVLRSADLVQLARLGTADRRRECLSALRQAAGLLMVAETLTPWQTAGRLRDEINRFEQRVLPLLRRNPAMPLTPLQDRLRVVFACRVGFPRTHERLYKELN